jgi:glycosyltransferase involved in cell wall biosynthesis
MVHAKDRHSPVFSLIVCTLGRQEPLRRLLESLVRQSLRDFEVVVVDQNEPGVLDAMIDEFGFRLAIVHVRAVPGLSSARNVGLARASGLSIAFPDDDCWYDADTLRKVFERMSRLPSAAIVSGRTTDREGAPSVSAFQAVEARISRGNYLTCGNSNCIFFRREVFSTIGHFDTRLGVGAPTEFQSGEEADVLLRALDAGLSAQYCPDLRVRHDQVDDAITEAQIRRARNYGRGFGALLRKHRFPPAVIAYRIGRPLVGAGLYLLLGRTALARYKWTWGRAIAEGYRRWSSGRPPREFERAAITRPM